MNHRIHRTIIVDECRTYIVHLSFITEPCSEKNISVNVISVMPIQTRQVMLSDHVKKDAQLRLLFEGHNPPTNNTEI